jgi:F-type H+-transporting ATPase subunit b
LGQALALRAQTEVFSIARKTLADLADASLEDRAAEVFIRRLRGLDGPVRDSLALALEAGHGPALVRSAFELAAAQRAAIQAAVNETFSAEIALRFDTAPDLVGGIELSANGQKVAWSIADYLHSLQRSVGELLEPTPTPAPGSR